MAAHTCTWTLFSCCESDINPSILKLEGDLDIVKMNLHTTNEVAGLRHLKLLTAVDEICMANAKRAKISLKVKMSRAPNYLRHYHNRYSNPAPTISDQYVLSCKIPIFR